MVRKRLKNCSLLALIVIGMVSIAAALYRRSDPGRVGLLSGATLITPVQDPMFGFWLSDHELVCKRVEPGVSRSKTARISLYVLDTRTRTEKPLEGLSAILRKDIAQHGPGILSWMSVSPDKKWVVWSVGSSTGTPVIAAATLDGKGYQSWTPELIIAFTGQKVAAEPIWFGDHTVASVVRPGKPPGACYIRDLSAPGRMRTVLYTSAEGKRFERLWLEPALRDGPGYSLEPKAQNPSNSMWRIRCYTAAGENKEIDTIHLPADSLVGRVVRAPDNSAILIHTSIIRVPVVESLLHRIYSRHEAVSEYRDDFYVYDLPKRRLKAIGGITQPAGSYRSLSNEQWLPGSRRFQFVHGFKLYTMGKD